MVYPCAGINLCLFIPHDDLPCSSLPGLFLSNGRSSSGVFLHLDQNSHLIYLNPIKMYSVIVALTGLPIGYSVIVALTDLPIGYSVIVALTGLPIRYNCNVIVALTV